MERFTFTVGKLDAGMAILIGERAHLIEFPSLLLPPGVTSGSIVNISVNRNLAAEKTQLKEFWSLQDSILQEYGLDSPTPPELKLRHVTQTSVTLEWPALNLAKADVRGLEIFKNGERLATIPNPKANTSTKLSSLQSNEEYTFQLVLKTTAGTYPSNVIRVRTHTMKDTSGISVCFGNVEDPTLLSHAKQALEKMKAKSTDKIQIDTTHFVCTNPASVGNVTERGESSATPSVEYQKATQMSLPIVIPQWVMACHAEKKLVPISNYHLGSSPKQAYSTEPFTRNSPNLSRRNSMAEAAEQLGSYRAPSPETIARMNMSPSSPTLAAPSQELPEVEPAQPQSGQEEVALPAHDTAPPIDINKQSNGENNGKLHRGFKFPTDSPATSGGESFVQGGPDGAEGDKVEEEQNEDVVAVPAVVTAEPEQIPVIPAETISTVESTNSEPVKVETKVDDDLDLKAKNWMEKQNTLDPEEEDMSAKQHQVEPEPVGIQAIDSPTEEQDQGSQSVPAELKIEAVSATGTSSALPTEPVTETEEAALVENTEDPIAKKDDAKLDSGTSVVNLANETAEITEVEETPSAEDTPAETPTQSGATTPVIPSMTDASQDQAGDGPVVPVKSANRKNKKKNNKK